MAIIGKIQLQRVARHCHLHHHLGGISMLDDVRYHLLQDALDVVAAIAAENDVRHLIERRGRETQIAVMATRLDVVTGIGQHVHQFFVLEISTRYRLAQQGQCGLRQLRLLAAFACMHDGHQSRTNVFMQVTVDFLLLLFGGLLQFPPAIGGIAGLQLRIDCSNPLLQLAVQLFRFLQGANKTANQDQEKHHQDQRKCKLHVGARPDHGIAAGGTEEFVHIAAEQHNRNTFNSTINEIISASSDNGMISLALANNSMKLTAVMSDKCQPSTFGISIFSNLCRKRIAVTAWKLMPISVSTRNQSCRIGA